MYEVPVVIKAGSMPCDLYNRDCVLKRRPGRDYFADGTIPVAFFFVLQVSSSVEKRARRRSNVPRLMWQSHLKWMTCSFCAAGFFQRREKGTPKKQCSTPHVTKPSKMDDVFQHTNAMAPGQRAVAEESLNLARLESSKFRQSASAKHTTNRGMHNCYNVVFSFQGTFIIVPKSSRVSGHSSLSSIDQQVRQSCQKSNHPLLFLVNHPLLSWKRWIPVRVTSQRPKLLPKQAVVDHLSMPSSRKPSPRHSNLYSAHLRQKLLVAQARRSISSKRPLGKVAPAYDRSFPNRTVRAVALVLSTHPSLMTWMSSSTSFTRVLPRCLFTIVEAIFVVTHSRSWSAKTPKLLMEGYTVPAIGPWKISPWPSAAPRTAVPNMPYLLNRGFVCRCVDGDDNDLPYLYRKAMRCATFDDQKM